MDTTSAIDYMKDVEVEDGVVDSLPARVLAPHMLHRRLHLAKTNEGSNNVKIPYYCGMMTSCIKS